MPAMISAALFDALQQAIHTPELPGLGPGPRPNVKSIQQLRSELKQLFEPTRLSQTEQALLNGAALLWHDHLEAAHAIAQQVDTTDGSLLHGLMHRREPDYGNAKYWFQRAGRHRCYPTIPRRVTAMLQDNDERLCRRLLPGGAWDAFAFVDACKESEAGKHTEARKKVLREIQRIEFEAFVEAVCFPGGKQP